MNLDAATLWAARWLFEVNGMTLTHIKFAGLPTEDFVSTFMVSTYMIMALPLPRWGQQGDYTYKSIYMVLTWKLYGVNFEMFQTSRTNGLSDLTSRDTSFALEDSGESSTNMLYLYGILPLSLLLDGLYESIMNWLKISRTPGLSDLISTLMSLAVTTPWTARWLFEVIGMTLTRIKIGRTP